MANANPTLDPILTQALLTGAWDAYCDFGGQSWSPPTGFSYLTRFTGWDDFIEPLGSVERYGLIFFRQQQNGLQLLIAFRGTDSLLDAYEDGFADFATFAPYANADNLPDQPVQVEAGFYGVYSLKGGGMTQSMQQQLFSLLAWLQPAEVLVTGHSLGSALSQLFTLDLAVSMPAITVTNINFASPRVGDTSWGNACASLGVSERITRVINYYDYVPTVPPEALGYVDVGAEFQVAFCAYYWFEANLYFNHMLGNMQVVLQNALATSAQQWTGTFSFQFLDVTIWMQSVAPPTDLDRDAWFARQQEAYTIAHPTPRPAGPAELRHLLRSRGPR